MVKKKDSKEAQKTNLRNEILKLIHPGYYRRLYLAVDPITASTPLRYRNSNVEKEDSLDRTYKYDLKLEKMSLNSLKKEYEKKLDEDRAKAEENKKRAEAKAEERRAEAKLEESLRFFNRPDVQADFEYCSKLSYWTLEESISIVMGKDPKVVYWDSIESYLKDSKFVKSFQRNRELAKRAVHVGELQDINSPSSFIAWAKLKNMPIPIELNKLIQDPMQQDIVSLQLKKNQQHWKNIKNWNGLKISIYPGGKLQFTDKENENIWQDNAAKLGFAKKSGESNVFWEILSDMANSVIVTHKQKSSVSKLRRLLQAYFNVTHNDDPFTYNKADGYKPKFELGQELSKLAMQAKNNAIKCSFDDNVNGVTTKNPGTEYPFISEGDETDNWLKNNK